MYYDDEDEFGLDLLDEGEEDDGVRRKQGISSFSIPKPFQAPQSKPFASILPRPPEAPGEIMLPPAGMGGDPVSKPPADFAPTQFENEDTSPVLNPSERRQQASRAHSEALDRLNQVTQRSPRAPTSSSRKWYENAIAGAAAGFGMKPIEMPRERKERQEFEREQGMAQAAADIAGKQATIARLEETDETNRELRKAQAEMYRRHGEAYDAQKDRPIKLGTNTWWDPKTRETFKVEGEVKPIPRGAAIPKPGGRPDEFIIPSPVNPANPPKPTQEQIIAQRTKDADAQGLQGRDKQVFILTGKIERPQRPPAAKTATPTQFRYIETKKQERLMKAEKEAKKRIHGDPVKGLEGEPPDAVYADLEREKQQIQDAYEAEIAASGGEPTHVEYDGQQKPAAPKPAAPAPKTQPKAAAPAKAASAAMAPAVGSTVTLKDGRTVVIKKINPDGTFEY
jgi:hypothetical protein